MKKNIMIIGGGASGMMAAITAAENGADAVILEHGRKLGRKLTATGNGKCNFTNVSQEPCDYHCSDPDFPWRVISRFPAPDTISFFLQLGIYSRNRKGYLYPYPEQSSAVLDSFQTKLDSLGVCYHLNTEVTAIQPLEGGGFTITADGSYKYGCDAVIIAGGSPAGSIEGASGSCYKLAAELGHNIIEPLPALVQLCTEAPFVNELSGLRTDALLSLYDGERLLNRERGELQFIRGGLSGIPSMQLSGDAAEALHNGRNVRIVMDFMPDFKDDLLFQFLKKRAECCGFRRNRDFLTGFLPKELGLVLIRECGLSPESSASFLCDDELRSLSSAIHAMDCPITGTFSAQSAQTMRGGVDTSQINDMTMESLICPGLYFAGEVVDVDGKCGGYNLQWAWSSGFLAGKSASSN